MKHPVDPAELAAYYARRAPEYERIYDKPERQADLDRLRGLLVERLAGRDVLEIACGTGYWTEVASRSTRSIVATDANEEVLAIARTKPCGCPVRFTEADAYAPSGVGGPFTAGLAGFWWSHVPRTRLGAFLDGFHAALDDKATVVLFDNRYVEGSSTPIARTSTDGDTFQLRSLDDGSTHEVLKNFPEADELRAVLTPHAADVEVVELEYFWLARYAPTGRSTSR
ncbi:MAG: class I SAM-dependent methyltransferase [Acidobacteriota bacterium]